jgi:hypothetical protein
MKFGSFLTFGVFVTSAIAERIVTHVHAEGDLGFESERRRVNARGLNGLMTGSRASDPSPVTSA